MMLSILTGGIVSAQSSKSESFKVYGNCDMCKNRIEAAVKSAGAANAGWDSKTKMLSVTYDPSKTNRAAIEKKVALAGHDTEKVRADDKAYNSLPGCCKYERAGNQAPAENADHSKMDHSKMNHSM